MECAVHRETNLFIMQKGVPTKINRKDKNVKIEKSLEILKKRTGR